MSNFIIKNATNQIITVDHLCLEVGHHVEQESLSRNMVLAKNQGLITIELGHSDDPYPNSYLRNPNGQDIALFPEQINQALGASSGVGTVTSVGLTLPNIFVVAGSPVTSTGTLSATLASQSAALVLASPSGAAGVPTFRALTALDLPAATTSAIGAVKKAAFQAQLAAAPTQADFNTLLTNLINAGIMSAS